jgi:hypothetical protein
MRGILIYPEGKYELSHAWGLGISSNNQVEAYAFYKD